jgi:hypothetical protein
MQPTDRWTTSLALCASLICSVFAAAATSPTAAPPTEAADTTPDEAPAPSWLLLPQPLRPALRAPLSAADAHTLSAHGGLLLVGLSTSHADAADANLGCTLSVSLGGYTQHVAVTTDRDQSPEDPTLLTFPLWTYGDSPAAPTRWLTLAPGDALTLRASDACEGLLLGAALLFDEAAAHALADPSTYWEGALLTLPDRPTPASAPPPQSAPLPPSAPDAATSPGTLWACF